MASSNPVLIPKISKWIWDINPSSILDVGIGFGRYGFICREVLEVWRGRYFKKDWKVRIDGVEIFAPFITEVQKYLYNKIILDDINNVNFLKGYDLIILGDIIEHFEKEQGKKLIEKLRKICNWMIIQTPYGDFPQGIVFDNPAEEHKSIWYPEDFEYKTELEIGNISGWNGIFAVLIKGGE